MSVNEVEFVRRRGRWLIRRTEDWQGQGESLYWDGGLWVPDWMGGLMVFDSEVKARVYWAELILSK